MKVARWGNSLAIRLPAEVVAQLALSEGDEVEVDILSDRSLAVAPRMTREQAIENLRALAKPLPPGWKFNRIEATEG